MPFGICVKGCNVSVLIEIAIAATDKVLTAVAVDLFPVVVIPTRVLDVTDIAKGGFSTGTLDDKLIV